ncbi:MAG: energy transducer TonB, partial [Caulobacteraceae bacterium]
MFIALLAAAAAACAPAPQGGVVRQPAFLSAPSTADLLAAIPASAAQDGISGEADLACRADEAGYLTDCRVVSEEPAGMGFGEAALTLSPRYRLAPVSEAGVRVACREVEIPVQFSLEGGDWRSAKVDVVTRPTWTAAPSFDDLASAWHGEDAEGPVRVVLDCQVRPDGSLERCRSEESSPFA